MLGLPSYGKSPVTSSNKSCSAFWMVAQATTLCSLCFLLGSPSISKSSIESHSRSASISWQNQTKQCFILWWQAFFHTSVGCCIRWQQVIKRLNQNKQCLILQTHGFFHTSVGCCIRWWQVLKRFNQIKQHLTFWWQTKQIYWRRIRIQHLSIGCRVNSDIKSWGSPNSIKHPSLLLRQFCCVDNHSKFWGSTSDACQFHADCWISLFQTIPSFLRRLQNILWGS